MSYQDEIKAAAAVLDKAGDSWSAIQAESVARMRLQNKFKTGLDIAKYTAGIMRRDMAEFDKDKTKYTQSLGCWHGFVGQQKLISIKKHFGTTKRRYLYLSGWMVAALRSEFGPLPDQSMHEKTAVASLVNELYTFLRQADARELGGLFRALDAAREAGDSAKEAEIQGQIDNYETHIVPIIADIDAGFGNAEATYLMAKQMIEAGDFLEWASVFGHLYGTSHTDTERHRIEGKDVMLVIDVQGARRVREQGVESVGIFVLPPSFATLEERLRQRSTRYSTEAQLRLRLETAREEVAACSGYEYVVVNADIDACVDQLRSIVLAERSKASAVRERTSAIAETFRAVGAPLGLAVKNHGGATRKG